MTTAFEKIKEKSMQGSSSYSPSMPSTQNSIPTTTPSSAFEKLKAKGAVPAQTTTPVDNKDSAVGGFLKDVISAPATLVARPVQAAAELAGASAEDVNKYTKKLTGGIVAPVPENTSDVVKDVGRGVQTVALGTGAPLATGAAFGFGGALENQGSNIFSADGATDALTSTLVGMGAGKALDLIGKPLLNASGKVIGKITPQILKDVAAKGQGAIEGFMAHHEILPEAVRPAVNAIPKVAEQFDAGVGKIFKGAGNTVADVAKSQYPNATKENIAKHYEDVEVDRLFEPTKKTDATYRNASAVVKDAERRGIDLKQIARDNKVYASDLVDEGKFSTQEAVDALRDETISKGHEVLRPALKAAEPGVPKVPVSEVRDEILRRIASIPDAKLSPAQKVSFAKKVAQEYGEGSAMSARYKDGLSLTNLYDSKLQTTSKLYKAPKGGGVQSIADSLTAQQKQIESQALDAILRKTAPPEIGLDDYFKAQEGRFQLAQYLESLNTKKAPQTLFQRGLKRAAQLGGATTGANIGGPFGMFSGYQFGGIMADTFAKAPNPVKVAYLKSIGKTEPEIYTIMKDFVSDAEAKSLSRVKLNAPDTIYVPPTQQGKPYTPNKAGFTTTPVVETKQKKLTDIYKK